jgi:hypothetical protein
MSFCCDISLNGCNVSQSVVLFSPWPQCGSETWTKGHFLRKQNDTMSAFVE